MSSSTPTQPNVPSTTASFDIQHDAMRGAPNENSSVIRATCSTSTAAAGVSYGMWAAPSGIVGQGCLFTGGRLWSDSWYTPPMRAPDQSAGKPKTSGHPVRLAFELTSPALEPGVEFLQELASDASSYCVEIIPEREHG